MCVYCDSPYHIAIVDAGTIEVDVCLSKTLHVEYHGNIEQEYVDVPINFCPMCGCDLRGDAS